MGDYYKKGDYNAVCALCGFEYKASDLRWNNQIQDYVCRHDWEPRHPQERLRAVEDIQSVPWVRLDPTDIEDVGDADVTLTPGTDDTSQTYLTDLTADRTVTLSTVGAVNGQFFKVTRTGHGSFDLDVGGLFTITNPISFGYAKVTYNGVAWTLTDSGIF